MTPEEEAAWLAQARELFGRAFGLQPGVPIKIRVSNALNPLQYIVYCIPEPNITSRVVTLAEPVEVKIPPSAGTGAGLPLLRPVRLSEEEKQVLRLCVDEILTGTDILRKLRWADNGTSRGVLSRLKNELHVMEKHGAGLRTTELGRLSLMLPPAD